MISKFNAAVNNVFAKGKVDKTDDGAVIQKKKEAAGGASNEKCFGEDKAVWSKKMDAIKGEGSHGDFKGKLDKPSFDKPEYDKFDKLGKPGFGKLDKEVSKEDTVKQAPEEQDELDSHDEGQEIDE